MCLTGRRQSREAALLGAYVASPESRVAVNEEAHLILVLSLIPSGFCQRRIVTSSRLQLTSLDTVHPAAGGSVFMAYRLFFKVLVSVGLL